MGMASLSRPFRKASSIRQAPPITSAPESRSSWTAAALDLREVGGFQVGFLQTSALEIRAGHHGAHKSGLHEVAAAQIDPFEPRFTQVLAAQHEAHFLAFRPIDARFRLVAATGLGRPMRDHEEQREQRQKGSRTPDPGGRRELRRDPGDQHPRSIGSNEREETVEFLQIRARPAVRPAGRFASGKNRSALPFAGCSIRPLIENAGRRRGDDVVPGRVPSAPLEAE